MKDFSALLTEEFNTQREHWEKALKLELKLEDISSKTSKKHLDLGSWATLSQSALSVQSLSGKATWKKASQTYFKIDLKTIESLLQEDLEAGVRAFFILQETVTGNEWSLIQKTLDSFSAPEEVEVFCLFAEVRNTKPKFKVYDRKHLLTASVCAENGGHNVLELALLTTHFIESLSKAPIYVGAYMDSHFFKNIAKIRALKILLNKVTQVSEVSEVPGVVALNSYREWTLYERYSNILRNNVQVASALIAGADGIQSSGYQAPLEFETTEQDAAHEERSRRMARNTSHILSLESMLGIVEDAAYGSHHLESLSLKYAEAAWELMQKMIVMDTKTRADYILSECQKTARLRLERVFSRKDILAGINDYPDGKEMLKVSLKKPHLFRVSRPFEELRLKVEGLASKPKVFIALQGDYAALSARINFIKNYFELIGLEVVDPLIKESSQKDSILVLCAKDEDYPALLEQYKNYGLLYVAGKVELPGAEAIYGGQNVLDVLSKLVTKIQGGK